jgi:hypothetical protein
MLNRISLKAFLIISSMCIVSACSHQTSNYAAEPNHSTNEMAGSELGNTDTGGDQTEDPQEIRCEIKLVSTEDLNPQVDCARVFNIKGKVEAHKGEGQLNFKNIKNLGIVGPNEILLDDVYRNVVRARRGGSATSLFNTLDLAVVDGNNTQIEFGKNTRIGEVGGTKAGRIVLDFGKLMVSNAVSPSSIPPSETSSIWFKTPHQISPTASIFSFASVFSQWIFQPAYASADEQIRFTSATLQLRTPESTIDTGGAVYLVERHPSRKETQVYSLTMRPIRVTDNFGKSVELRRNQTVLVTQNGIEGSPFEFPLCGSFYRQHADVLKGLVPQEEPFVMEQPYPLQIAYHAARSMTLPLYHQNCQRVCLPPPPKGSGK